MNTSYCGQAVFCLLPVKSWDNHFPAEWHIRIFNLEIQRTGREAHELISAARRESERAAKDKRRAG